MITQEQFDKASAAANSSSSGGSGPDPRIRNIRGLLRLLPNAPAVGRDAWVMRAFQIRALAYDEADGGAAFDEWSQKHASYDAAETARVWESIHTVARTSGVGLLVDAEAADHDGFTDVMNGEARAAFDDGVEHPKPPSGGGAYRPTHVGCAEAVIAERRGQLGWLSNASHRWAAFDEVMGRWVVGDDDGEMRTAVRLEVERRRAAGVGAREAKAMTAGGWRGSVQGLLVRELRLRITAGRFDADYDVVGVPGGVLRLNRAMGLSAVEAGRPGHMVSKALAVRPDGGSKHPVWDKFLRDFTMGDASLALWWQAFCGYCLTGHTTEQLVVFLYGPGGNGKSVFLDIVGEVMGDYHCRADHRLFMAKVGNFHLAPLAALDGARLVTCPDVGTGAAWDVGLVKALTGGGLITANRMRENPYSFEPQCKVVLAGNEKPRLDNVDAGVKRRFLLIPATAVPKRVDKGLMEKLRGERGAILDWMLRGWGMWALGGLPQCTVIEQETESYLEGADVWGRWLREGLSKNPGDTTRHRLSDLWMQWDTFKAAEGAFKCVPLDRTVLSTKLREAGFSVSRDNKGSYVDGISIRKIDVF